MGYSKFYTIVCRVKGGIREEKIEVQQFLSKRVGKKRSGGEVERKNEYIPYKALTVLRTYEHYENVRSP